MDFLGREPSGVFECLSHVGRLQVRVVREDLVDARPVSDCTDDDGDGDSHPTDAGSSTEYRWVEGDSIERTHDRSLRRFEPACPRLASPQTHSEQPSPSGPAVSRYFGDGHDFTHTGKLQPALPRGTT